MRVFFGFFLFFCAVISIMVGGIFLSLVLGAACVMGGKEFIGMARKKGIKPSARIVLGMIIAFHVVAAVPALPLASIGINLAPNFAIDHFPLLLTIGIYISFFRLLFRQESTPATIADIASTILGFIYVGWLPVHLVLLRNLTPLGLAHISNPLQQPGLAYVWASLFVIWATDISAYYCGKTFGKHLLYPLISPKKTVEGAVGGLIAAVFVAAGVVYLADNYLFACHPFQHNMWQAPLLGALVSVAAQLGDLCESLLKRDAGVKDSSDIIPGHGGFLDRGDSLIMGGAISYYWVWLVVLGNI
jgi:phosphatidate cytidylyltransferase